MKTAIHLSEQGYWVFPLRNKLKYPTKFQGLPWTDFIKEKDQELMHALFINDGQATGAGLCPRSTDKVKLLILDLDCYGYDLEMVWSIACPGVPLPSDVPVVQSVSGGWHMYFRLPDNIDGDKLPATFDFGSEVSGELRVSGKRLSLIVLPDTSAINKSGVTGKYKLVQGSLMDLESIPVPPDVLISRMVARKDQGKTETAEPTEVIHLLEILEDVEDLYEGGRNLFVAKVGQVLGRVHPAPQMSSKLYDRVKNILLDKLGDFSEKEFKRTIMSGFKTGSKNAESYKPHEKHPSITDVKAECESVFGAVPWLVEVRDSTGKTKEWLVGYGGSAKRRHEAKKMVKLKDLKDILPSLTRLTSARMDTVVRSPLFIQTGWTKALEYMLNAQKAVDQLGIPPEERYWELLNEWARIAASDQQFIEAWTEKRSFGSSTSYICYPLADNHTPALVVPPLLQEALLIQVGDIPKAQRLVKQNMLKKTLVGMRSGQKVWVLPLSKLEPECEEYCSGQYEAYVRTKTNA